MYIIKKIQPKKLLSSFIAICLLMACDLLSKYYAHTHFVYEQERYRMGDAFAFFLTHNVPYVFRGLSVYTSLWISNVMMALTFVALFYFLTIKISPFIRFNLTLIVGGGLANLVDRCFNGYVIDFISLPAPHDGYFAVVNVADIFIYGGVAMLTLYIMINEMISINKKEPFL